MHTGFPHAAPLAALKWACHELTILERMCALEALGRLEAFCLAWVELGSIGSGFDIA